MKLGRISGNVVSTISNPIFDGRKLLLCDLLDERGRETGDYTIAVDSVGAGPGETVLILDEGNSARQVVGDPDGAIRAVVVGIVDELALAG
jgi:ethanolamine utilization protein EutN